MESYLFIGGSMDGQTLKVTSSVEHVTRVVREPHLLGLRTPVPKSSTYRKHYLQCGTLTVEVFAEMTMKPEEVLKRLINYYPQPN